MIYCIANLRYQILIIMINKSTQKIFTFILVLLLNTITHAQVSISASSGTTGPTNYTDLSNAFIAVNNGTHKGDITIEITGDVIQTMQATLNASGSGSANYSSILIKPSGNRTISAATLNGTLILLSGADNVTIDGLNSGGNSLALINKWYAEGSQVISFTGGANNNTITNCKIEGASPWNQLANLSLVAAVVSFKTGGNSNNTISNCDISGVTSNSYFIKRPGMVIFSYGSSSVQPNANNSIINNRIFDFIEDYELLNHTKTYAIHLNDFNPAWTITGNSFYQTTPLTLTMDKEIRLISISNTNVNDANSIGNDYNISNNYFGGSAPNCGGNPWVKTDSTNNAFTAIFVKAGTTTTTNIQGNTITNFDWSNSGNANWEGISVTGGNVNVGTIKGNIVGSATGTGSITFKSGASNSNFYGINLYQSANQVVCQNNTVGSITTATAAPEHAANFWGLYGATLNLSFINNTVGSTTTPNSIFASSPATANAQSVCGIRKGATTSGNIIANLTNGTSNDNVSTEGYIIGILDGQQVLNNTIHNLKISNANNLGSGNLSNINFPSAAGIYCSLNQGTIQNFDYSQNTIYNISNDHPSFVGAVTGLCFLGPAATNPNIVSRNFIYGLSVNNQSTNANIYGILSGSGKTNYSNNIIAVDCNTQTNVYGIDDRSMGSGGTNLYFNTVSLSGQSPSGALNSYALYSRYNNFVRDFRNNIFVNERSNTGSATGSHYGAWFNYSTNNLLTLDYNNYYVSGQGGVLGRYNSANVTSLPIVTDKDGFSLSVNPLFDNPGGSISANYIPSATILSGIAGTNITNDFANNTRGTLPAMGAFEYPVSKRMSIVATEGETSGNYTTIKEVFDAINAGTHRGDITISVNGNSTLTSTATLNAGGSGKYNSVRIVPNAGSAIQIVGNIAGALLNLDGATNVTIDGLNTGGNSLTLSNSNTLTSATTIIFRNGASSNTITNCNILGSTTQGVITNAGLGVITFAESTATIGNNNNTISNNIISHAGSDSARPINAIYSFGTSGKENTNNNIRGNKFYDFFRHGASSYAIHIRNNSKDWNILNNHFYETTSFVPTTISSDYRVINIINTLGGNFTVSGNFIGGTEPNCEGNPWEKTNLQNNSFAAIYLSTNGTEASNIQGNTISNFNWSNSISANWYGIWIYNGLVNIGTVTGNIIGAKLGTDNITYTASNNNANFYGIYLDSGAIVNCNNNTIASIKTAQSNITYPANISGIYKIGTGNTVIKNNTIGNSNVPNSIVASAPATGNSSRQTVYGVYSQGSDTIEISDNSIANLTNGTTDIDPYSQDLINGVAVLSGATTIVNNLIHDLRIANANITMLHTASAAGIVVNNTSAISNTISQNVIYAIHNTKDDFAGLVYGLYYNGGTTASTVSRNYIHDLGVGNATTDAKIYGICINSGTANYTNNIISLGGNTETTLYGIYETGAASNNNNLYFNTVSISGTPASGSRSSYSLWSNSSSNVRNFRNNIFVNERSNNSTASGSHYAAWFNYTVNTNLTLDYNNYFVSGTGGVLGRYKNADVTALPLITTKDANSLNVNPDFASSGETNAMRYQTAVSLPGTYLLDVSQDFIGNNRVASSTQIGAFNNQNLSIPTYSKRVAMYPNPVKAGQQSFMIIGISDTSMVSLYNFLGQKIPATLTPTTDGIQVQVSQGITPGVYIVQIVDNKAKKQLKWIVE